MEASEPAASVIIITGGKAKNKQAALTSVMGFNCAEPPAFLDVTTLRSINTHFLLTAVTLMHGTMLTVTHGGGRPVPHSRSSICSVATTSTGHTWE